MTRDGGDVNWTQPDEPHAPPPILIPERSDGVLSGGTATAANLIPRAAPSSTGGRRMIETAAGPDLGTGDLVTIIIEILRMSWGIETEGKIWFGAREGQPLSAQQQLIAAATTVPIVFFSDRSQLPGGSFDLLPEGEETFSVTPAGWIRPNVVSLTVARGVGLTNGVRNNLLFEYIGGGMWGRIEAEEIGVTTTSAVS